MHNLIYWGLNFQTVLWSHQQTDQPTLWNWAKHVSSNFVLTAAVRQNITIPFKKQRKGFCPYHTHHCRVVGPGINPRNNCQVFITTASEGCALCVITRWEHPQFNRIKVKKASPSPTLFPISNPNQDVGTAGQQMPMWRTLRRTAGRTQGNGKTGVLENTVTFISRLSLWLVFQKTMYKVFYGQKPHMKY